MPETVVTFNSPPDQNTITVRIPVNPAGLGSGVSCTVLVEQSEDGSTWWPLGGFSTPDVVATLQGTDKFGNPVTALEATFTEQIYRHDVFTGKGWSQSHELIQGNAHYHQLALAPQIRVTVTSSAPLNYQVEHVIEKRPMPPVPLGQKSASLVGVFAGAESGSLGTLTTGSRTTISGTLITVTTACGGSGGTQDINVATDNQGNTFTERIDFAFNGGLRREGISTHLAGTRGAGHTCTSSWDMTFPFGTVCAQEWDGIHAAPTYDTATASGASTAPSVAVTPTTGTALLVGVGTYDSIASTISVNSGTEAQEQDDNNDAQVQNVNYKVAASGSTTLSWTLGASTQWGAIVLAITESAGAPAAPHTLLTLGCGA